MTRTILIVTNRAPWPLQDGGAMAMHQLINGYKAQGWRVHLLAMNTHRHWAEEAELRAVYSSIDGITIFPFDNRLKPARLARNFFLSRKPEHAERFYDPGFERALEKTIKRIRPDAVQMESPFLSGYLPAIRRESNAVLVLRMHNVEHQIWSRTAGEASGGKRFYLRALSRRMKRYEEWAWSRYDLLLPISREDEKAVRDAGCNTQTHLTPFGIDTKAASTQLTQKSYEAPRKFYHLGAMDWLPNREGVAWFVRDAWPRILAEHPTAQFHFGGRLLESDFAAPLPPGVFNHGPVQSAALFTAGMDVLVVPLRAGGGIRVKILEAMAAGKAVISTSVGIQGIAAEPGMHFLRADTAREFAGGVHLLVEHSGERQKIIAAAKALVADRYDAVKIAARLSERLLRLLQERR